MQRIVKLITIGQLDFGGRMRSQYKLLWTYILFSLLLFSLGPPLYAQTSQTEARRHFEIEGVRLGMTMPELLSAAKKVGTPKVSSIGAGAKKVEFETRDLQFVVSFTKTGILDRMDLFSRMKVKGSNDLQDYEHAALHSSVLRRATEAWGKPTGTDADESLSWTSPTGAVASYYLQDDTVEVMTK